MPEPDDHQLLAEYVRTASEPAFAALVGRYVNLVYSAAWRSTGNPHQAEEITQAVFIILARKGPGLSRRVVLSGWLYRVARFTAANFLKGENRRRRREQEAFMQSTLNESPADTWQQLAPLLDEAMDQLGQTDRDALVLRYFENKTAAEIGAVLRLNEETARKRVNRALEKLHRYLARRGMISSAGTVGLAISSYSIQAAPPALAQTVAAMAVAKGAAASISTLTLLQSTLKIMAWTKVKTAIIAGACVLFAVGTTTLTVHEVRSHNTYPWQVQPVTSEILRKAPPQVRIVPTKFSAGGGEVAINDAGSADGAKRLGISQSVDSLVGTAYGQSVERMIFEPGVPPGRYDYIANLPSGNSEALQREIRRTLGLAGRKETRETDVLVLKVQTANAPGLKPHDPRKQGSHMSSNPGHYTTVNGEVADLAWFLETSLKIPVVNQTGLKGNYDIELTWPGDRWGRDSAWSVNRDRLSQALIDQLGLVLEPARAPIEMLVVAQVK